MLIRAILRSLENDPLKKINQAPASSQPPSELREPLATNPETFLRDDLKREFLRRLITGEP